MRKIGRRVRNVGKRVRKNFYDVFEKKCDKSEQELIVFLSALMYFCVVAVVFAAVYLILEGIFMPKSFAQTISDADVLVTGIKTNAEKLADVNLTAEKAEQISDMVSSIRALNAKQEQLKSDLKNCTAEIDSKLKELSAAVSDARKRVKLALPKENWTAFGISDKK